MVVGGAGRQIKHITEWLTAISLQSAADTEQGMYSLKKLRARNLQSVIFSKESEDVFTLLKEINLHVTQSFLQLRNLILSLLKLPCCLVLQTDRQSRYRQTDRQRDISSSFHSQQTFTHHQLY